VGGTLGGRAVKTARRGALQKKKSQCRLSEGAKGGIRRTGAYSSGLDGEPREEGPNLGPLGDQKEMTRSYGDSR